MRRFMIALIVSFEAVVHPALAEETEVAEASVFHGEPDERAQECAPDTA